MPLTSYKIIVNARFRECSCHKLKQYFQLIDMNITILLRCYKDK